MIAARRQLAAVICLLVAGCGGKEPAAPTRTVREPSAEISVSPARAKVAEIVELKIVVEHAKGLKARLPAVGATLEDMEVVDPGSVSTRHLEPGVDVTERTVTLRAFRPGAYSLGPFDVLLVPEEGTVQSVSTKKAQVEIYSVLKGSSRLADLRPSKGPFELTPEPSGWTGFIVASVVVLAVAAGGAWLLRRSAQVREERERAATRRPPDEVALEELRRIRDSGILDEGRIAQYTDEVSDVLRRYLEARYDLPAPERTTEEFLDVIAREPVLDRDRKKFLADYLAQCDLVKFAAQDPGRRELEGLYASSVTFVRETTASSGTGSA